MSVAFETTSNRIQSPRFSHGMWIYSLSDSSRFTGGNPWRNRLPVVKEEEDSSTSSSIGNNSDALSGGGNSDEDDGEVQSEDNGPFNGLTDLEQFLPIKRGISTFYAGKLKSYGTLADASSVPSIQDIAKQEDAYTRKRKNLIAHAIISKRHARNSHESDENGESSNSRTSMAGLSLPPLPENRRRLAKNETSDSSPRLYTSQSRSLSLPDLQHASAATLSNKKNEYDEYH